MKSKNTGKKKVLMALSGGIDSAVSAYLLLRQGYEVEAAFMKNWSSTAGLKHNECPWLKDRQDALRVAAFLRIPLHTLDFEDAYANTVMEYFFKEYEAGRTPNPDVMCNKEIKFKLLYNWAMERGFDYLATGHYAQISSKYQVVSPAKRDPALPDNKLTQKPLIPNTSYLLLRSNDEFKDQTYFIYNIQKEQLPHVLFPIGHLKKTQVKALAEKIGLPNVGKKESMGLCFVGKIRLKDFLEQKLKPVPGPIFDQQGHVLGQHEGLYNYTVGQRQGIKVGPNGPYYVVRKDLATNALFVTNDPNDAALLTKEIQLHSVNWLTSSPAYSLTSLFGRFRHQAELVPLSVTQTDNDTYNVKFKKPQKAVASGQSLVLYKGKVCVGGGVIV